MSTIDRDPIVSEERIAKRRKLLEHLHAENLAELANPALIRDEIEPEVIIGECQEPNCLLQNKTIDAKEAKTKKWMKLFYIGVTILAIVALSLVAVFVGNLGK
ncbi:hypothetical protein [Mycoplasmopsis columbinasalis]|uniref:Uncharacterized protein n=1 Tax=Mycoplasmopsis columbinasalis TaxID=114880 RepID=A0A449B9M9_9BACT|nr:hypothetical protein [Mycoplasmopsis columbinasalis]VEU77879.1 Uncharacterised protein [Mycoplasmopsis columbinasalis]